MSSILSSYNNTNSPLPSLITFGGKYELVNGYTSYSLGIKTDSDCFITIYQSYDGVTDDDFDIIISTADVFLNHQANLYLPYARISIFNGTGTNQTYILCTTKWMSVNPLPFILSNVALAPNSNVFISGGSLILDTGTATIGAITIDPSTSLPSGTNSIGTISISAIDNLIKIDQTSSLTNGISIKNSIPTGTNSIGTVGINSSLNFIKIDGLHNQVRLDQTTIGNGVLINPTALPPARATGLSDIATGIGCKLLYGVNYQNKSATVNCWVKLYDTDTAPTASDIPFVIQYLESVKQYNLTSANNNFFNTPIVNTLWIRATLLSNDNDTTDTGIDAEVTCFIGT